MWYIIIIGGIVIAVVFIATRPSKTPVPKPRVGKARITDNDSCEHTVDANGFIKCTGTPCTAGQNCTLQRRLVGIDPWKDVDMQTTDNNEKLTNYEFRCVCK